MIENCCSYYYFLRQIKNNNIIIYLCILAEIGVDVELLQIEVTVKKLFYFLNLFLYIEEFLFALILIHKRISLLRA